VTIPEVMQLSLKRIPAWTGFIDKHGFPVLRQALHQALDGARVIFDRRRLFGPHGIRR